MKENSIIYIIKEAFFKYLDTGPRSNEKLKILHSFISNDIRSKINYYSGEEGWEVISLSNISSREGEIKGRYYTKRVDILIELNGEEIAGVGIKFIMSNYHQNANNYFENMLGETANIRTANKKYFQIYILPYELPYFKKNGEIKKWEILDCSKLEKYLRLSQDNISIYYHTPDKTLLFIFKYSDKLKDATSLSEYKDIAEKLEKENNFTIDVIKSFGDCDLGDFGSSVIVGDYDLFVEKLVHSILST